MRARIALLPGDGIGPEVIGEARAVLERVGSVFGHDFELSEGLIGAAALEATGEPLPEETVALCAGSDAALLGAVGSPRWSDPALPRRPEQGLLELRSRFGLFANLRPVTADPSLAALSPVKEDRLAGVDLMIVRELTGGLYFGPREEQGEGDRAFDTLPYSVAEVERVARVAFELARRRRRSVVSVDKANVLASSRLWRRVVERVAAGYPEVRLEHQLVDSCAMLLIQSPARFDVLLTENLFGDVLSDEASVLAGSLGLLPSASLGSGRFGLYEPVHGSAPDLAGRGVANPLGAIASAALLLRWSLRLEREAAAVEAAIGETLAAGLKTADLCRPDEKPATTAEVGRAVAERLASRLRPSLAPV